MVVQAPITKGVTVRRSLIAPLTALSLSGCALIHTPVEPYVDQSPGMTDTQLSTCISDPAVSDAQQANCRYEQARRASAPSVKSEHLEAAQSIPPSVPQHRMNPMLNDGQWHSFGDKSVEYRKTAEDGEYPSLYIKYHLKGGKSAITKESFNCSASKFSVSSSITYSKNGDVVDSYTATYEIWNDILPDTNAAFSLFQACLKTI